MLVELFLPARRELLVQILRLGLGLVAVQLRAGAVLSGVGPRPGESQLATGVEDLQALAHHGPEHGRLLLGDEVEAEDLLAALVSPLVKGLGGLVVPQARLHRTVENHLVTGLGNGHYSEGLLLEMVENVDIGHEAGSVARWNPFLANLLVQHHFGSGPSYA